MEIKVSVLCLAYNHGEFIKDALEGFVNQKTNFKYEVLINDDCSTDNTASIIKEYELKYPDIIKPVYQKENQYSKRVNITKNILLPLAKGKYVAFCEGDDYWIDENKLQMQYDYMEANPDCTFCFTDAKAYDCTENKFVDYFDTYKSDKKALLSADKLSIKEVAHATLPTATYFFPKENYNRFPKEYDEYCPGGDLKLELFSIYLGCAHFINVKTTVYRMHVPNSATTRWSRMSDEDWYKVSFGFLTLYRNIDRLTNYKYHNDLGDDIHNRSIGVLYSSNNKKLLKDKDFKKEFDKEPLSIRIKIWLKLNFPKVYNYIKRIKNN